MLLSDLEHDVLDAVMEHLTARMLCTLMLTCQGICTVARRALDGNETFRERKKAAAVGAKLATAMRRYSRRLGAPPDSISWFTLLPIEKFLTPRHGLCDLFAKYFSRDGRPLSIGMSVVVLHDDGSPMTMAELVDDDEEDDDDAACGFIKAIDADGDKYEVICRSATYANETTSFHLPAKRIQPRWPSESALIVGMNALQDWHPSAFAHVMLCLTRRDDDHSCLLREEDQPTFETGVTDENGNRQMAVADIPGLQAILAGISEWDSDGRMDGRMDGVSQWLAGFLCETSDCHDLEIDQVREEVKSLVTILARATAREVACPAAAARILNVLMLGNLRPPVRSVWENAKLVADVVDTNRWILSGIILESLDAVADTPKPEWLAEMLSLLLEPSGAKLSMEDVGELADIAMSAAFDQSLDLEHLVTAGTAVRACTRRDPILVSAALEEVGMFLDFNFYHPSYGTAKAAARLLLEGFFDYDPCPGEPGPQRELMDWLEGAKLPAHKIASASMMNIYAQLVAAGYDQEWVDDPVEDEADGGNPGRRYWNAMTLGQLVTHISRWQDDSMRKAAEFLYWWNRSRAGPSNKVFLAELVNKLREPWWPRGRRFHKRAQKLTEGVEAAGMMFESAGMGGGVVSSGLSVVL